MDMTMRKGRNEQGETLRDRWRRISQEYAASGDIMDGDDLMASLKTAVAGLPQTDRVVMLLYADCGSYRELGRLLGVSHMTVRREIQRIRREILDNGHIR